MFQCLLVYLSWCFQICLLHRIC
uniref:Uncharacterized protein n=1 Tax=Arundo donax TaxID=35708 RepID=A0A0A9EGZ7_ARUDO